MKIWKRQKKREKERERKMDEGKIKRGSYVRSEMLTGPGLRKERKWLTLSRKREGTHLSNEK